MGDPGSIAAMSSTELDAGVCRCDTPLPIAADAAAAD